MLVAADDLCGEEGLDVSGLESDRFNELRSRGQGYVEVRSPNSEFPEAPIMDDLTASRATS